MKIANTSETSVNALKMAIYGESGSGKTTLAGTIQEPTLIISAEAGLLSLSGKTIDVIDVSQDDNGAVIPKEQRIKRLGEVYNYLLTDEAKKKYKVIFIDSLSELNQNMLEELQVDSHFGKKENTLPMYGELSKKMRSLVKLFRDLPHYSVIFSALSEKDKDENGVYVVQPQLVGKFAQQLPAYFDLVLYLHADKDTNKRKLVTQKTDRLVAKDRSGALSPEEPADLGLIFDKIRKVTVTK